MYCGIGIRMYGDLNILRNKKIFKFEEEEKGCFSANYWGFKIHLNYNLGFVDLKGSFHRFKNGGSLNYDKFKISQFIETLKVFEKIFELNKFNQKYFWGLEFGVNIYLPYDPWIVIDSIIPYSGTGDFKRESYGIKIEHNKYYDLKLYVKSDQIVKNKKYSVDYIERHILRLEIKVHNMKFINKMLAKTSLKRLTKMSDLVHPIVIFAFQNRLLQEFEKLLVVDRELFDESELSTTDRKLYKNVWKKSYWKQYEYKKDEPKKRAIAKSKERIINYLKSIIYQRNELKSELRYLIIKSLDCILDIKNVANSTIWSNPKSEIILRKIGDHNEYAKRLLSQFPLQIKESIEVIQIDLFGCENLIKTSKDERKGHFNMSHNFYLDKLGICDKLIEKYRRCFVTGLPLFLDKDNGKFLSGNEIEFYHNYYPEVYSELLKIIAPIHHNKPNPVLYEKIAHAVRNRDSNPRNNEKKRISRKNNPDELKFDFQ